VSSIRDLTREFAEIGVSLLTSGGGDCSDSRYLNSLIAGSSGLFMK
jgi:hypothetical protein